MTFSLRIDSKKFDKHIASVREAYSKSSAEVVPVIKGNGYGFGHSALCTKANSLSFSHIAIGTIWEAESALAHFSGTITVLEPVNIHDTAALSQWREVLKSHAHRIVATISSVDVVSVSDLALNKVILDIDTSLHRFGFTNEELIASLRHVADRFDVIGFTAHLPIAEPQAAASPQLENIELQKLSAREREVHTLAHFIQSLSNEYSVPAYLSLSHLDAKQMGRLTKSFSNITFTVRIGTQLWLGAPDALTVSGTVLEIHNFELGDHTHVGYRQVDSHGNKRLLVISGGTSHGVALSAPSAPTSLRRRGVSVAQGVLEALGKVRSPFSFNGEVLTFAEPPHMHVSLVWTENTNIAVGDHIDCAIRNTTAHFDLIEGLN